MTDARTAQLTVETFDTGAPEPRTAQLTVETFDTGTPQPRTAQLTVEAFTLEGASAARVAQLWIELFASPENEPPPQPPGYPWMLAG